MANKKKKRFPILKYLIMSLASVATVFFFYETFREIQTNRNLHASIEESEKVITDLQKEKEKLQVMEDNLGNPEYLQRIARGKFMYTKDGEEQVFKLPEDKK